MLTPLALPGRPAAMEQVSAPTQMCVQWLWELLGVSQPRWLAQVPWRLSTHPESVFLQGD